ncbi:MAG: Rpn family recombination-promoting nuclease/putative transposase [Bacteroidota bacterium]
MRYLDPKNDLTFKKVFGQHPHLLRSFLNALLPLEKGRKIVELEYLPADMVPIIPLLKYSIVDVRCTDNRGRQFIVEMQMLWTDTFKHRVLFNASKAYVKQLDRGKEYKGLKPVYALSLVNENFEHDTDLYYHHYSMIHHELTGKKIEGLELIFVELPKFKAKNLTEKKLQVLWLRYLTDMEEKIEQPPTDLLEVPEIKEAIDQLAESAFSKSELESYDKYWDSISSEKTLISEAEETGRLLGEQQGLEKGRKEGLEEGLIQGREEGIKEEKIAIARKLKAQGMRADQIAAITGLKEEEIIQL